MHPKDNYTLLKINGVFGTYDTHYTPKMCLFKLQAKTNYLFLAIFIIVKKNLRRRKYEYIFISNKLFEVCLWNTSVYTNIQLHTTLQIKRFCLHYSQKTQSFQLSSITVDETPLNISKKMHQNNSKTIDEKIWWEQ